MIQLKQNSLLKIALLSFLFLINKESLAQYAFSDSGDTIKVPVIIYMNSDINFSSSANDNRDQSKAGTGKLGIKFEHGFLYGHVNFNVYSKNKEITTADSAESKLFGTNLLLPQNSPNSLGNFSMSLGTRSFCNYTSVRNADFDRFFTWKKLGCFANFNLNNNVWTKDSLSTNITINNFNVAITYNILSAYIANETNSNDDNQLIRLYAFAGITTRRLGGDFGLSDGSIRKAYLNSDKLGFNGLYGGVKLDIGKFYGQMQLSSFNKNDKILGFSGNQAVIAIGLTPDFKLVARSNSGTAVKTKAERQKIRKERKEKREEKRKEKKNKKNKTK